MRLFLLYNMKMDLIRQLDISTLNFVEQIRTPFLTLVFKAVTFMGEWYFVLGVLVLISLFFIIKKTSRFRLATRRNLDVFLIIKNREIEIRMPKTKYHSPIKVTALKKVVKNGVRIFSAKFRVEKSSCLIKSII